MIKNVLSTFIILAVTVLASSLWDVRPDRFFTSTIFTIAGIMFSIGLGLIVTFNPSGIKNKTYLREIRSNIMHVRNSFLIHFGLSSFYYVLNEYVMKKELTIRLYEQYDLKLSITILLCLLMLYSSAFFVVNFIQIQKLNNDIFDAVNKENS